MKSKASKKKTGSQNTSSMEELEVESTKVTLVDLDPSQKEIFDLLNEVCLSKRAPRFMCRNRLVLALAAKYGTCVPEKLMARLNKEEFNGASATLGTSSKRLLGISLIRAIGWSLDDMVKLMTPDRTELLPEVIQFIRDHTKPEFWLEHQPESSQKTQRKTSKDLGTRIIVGLRAKAA